MHVNVHICARLLSCAQAIAACLHFYKFVHLRHEIGLNLNPSMITFCNLCNNNVVDGKTFVVCGTVQVGPYAHRQRHVYSWSRGQCHMAAFYSKNFLFKPSPAQLLAIRTEQVLLNRAFLVIHRHVRGLSVPTRVATKCDNKLLIYLYIQETFCPISAQGNKSMPSKVYVLLSHTDQESILMKSSST